MLGSADFWADYTAPIALVLLSVIFTLRSPVFLSAQNIRGMLADSSLIIVLALGMTFVIAIGGIDLSIATTVTLASVMMGVAYAADWPLPLVVLVGLATGALVGSFNGALVGWVKIPDFIVTLGSFSLTSGIALVVSQGIPVQISDQLLRTLSTGSIWLFRLNFLLAVTLSIALHILLFHMQFGTYVLATGGNLDAARAMGISVARTKFLTYVLCGSLAGVTAVMLIAFIGAAQPAPSTQFLLTAIAGRRAGRREPLRGTRDYTRSRGRSDLFDGPIRRADAPGFLRLLPAARRGHRGHRRRGADEDRAMSEHEARSRPTRFIRCRQRRISSRSRTSGNPSAGSPPCAAHRCGLMAGS